MDSWYATQKLMAQIDQLQKVYYCPLKTNRRVDDSGGTMPYQRIDELVWSAEDLQQVILRCPTTSEESISLPADSG